MADLNTIIQNQLSILGKIAPALNAAGSALNTDLGKSLTSISYKFEELSKAPTIYASVNDGKINLQTTPFKTTTTSTNVTSKDPILPFQAVSGGLGSLLSSPMIFIILLLVVMFAFKR